MEDFNAEGILQSLLGNPALMKGAMELAAKLSAPLPTEGEGGGADSSYDPSPEESRREDSRREDSREAPHKGREDDRGGEKTHHGDMVRHKKLLEALSLYVSEEKREKLAFMIKVLDLWELARSMGILGGNGV